MSYRAIPRSRVRQFFMAEGAQNKHQIAHAITEGFRNYSPFCPARGSAIRVRIRGWGYSDPSPTS
jgi:hypothetical protein